MPNFKEALKQRYSKDGSKSIVKDIMSRSNDVKVVKPSKIHKSGEAEKLRDKAFKIQEMAREFDKKGASRKMILGYRKKALELNKRAREIEDSFKKEK